MLFMKSIHISKIYIAGSLLLVLAGAACKKNVLDAPMDLNVTDSTIFKNIFYVTDFVTNIYSGTPSGYRQLGLNSGTLTECATDDARHANNANDVYRLTNGSWGPTINFDDVWTGSYRNIRRCNQFFENIDLVKMIDHNDTIRINTLYATDQKYRLIGEVYFLRAFSYFELCKRYGGVPVVTKTLSLNDDIDLPRNNFDETVAQIVKDCDSAFKRLPATYIGLADNYYGRATKWAAAALKARILLYAASTLNNPTADRAKWVKAYEAAKPFFDGTAGFALPNGIAGYEGTFRGNTATNTEIIWSRVETNNNFVETDNYPVGEVNGTGGVCPSQYLVDAFEMKDGLPWNQSPLYDAAKPYDNRDPRFAATILYNNANFKSRKIETFTNGVDGPQKVNGSLTGYYMRKHIDLNLNLLSGQTAQHNWVHFRLGEMLLNYAEALNEADGAVGDVYTAVNRIRTRVGMPGLPVGLSKEQMRDRIRNERRIELSFEGHRYWDARRWDIAKTDFNRKMRGMKIEQTSPGVFTYTPYDLEDRVFAGYMNRYPIQLRDILANPKLEQNDGWK
jgi:hypothetical protein